MTKYTDTCMHIYIHTYIHVSYDIEINMLE